MFQQKNENFDAHDCSFQNSTKSKRKHHQLGLQHLAREIEKESANQQEKIVESIEATNHQQHPWCYHGDIAYFDGDGENDNNDDDYDADEEEEEFGGDEGVHSCDAYAINDPSGYDAHFLCC